MVKKKLTDGDFIYQSLRNINLQIYHFCEYNKNVSYFVQL